jgi:mRNA interferase MazF
MTRGEIWWVDLGIPFGSEPGYKRPVVIIQDDSFNRSKIKTVIVASITTNLELANAPGNIYLESDESGLPKQGVINVSQISTIDKNRLIKKVRLLSYEIISEINFGLKTIFNIH